MKTQPRQDEAAGGFEDEYRSSLREYAAGGGEPALGRAYELGRRALTEQRVSWRWLPCIIKLWWLWFAMRKVGNAGRNCSGRAPNSSRSAYLLMRWHTADFRMR